MKMLGENLEVALRIAIEVMTEQEKEMGYRSDSAILAGWKSVLEALRNREPVYVERIRG